MRALATDGQRSLCVADHRQSLANSALRLHDRKESIPHLSMRMRGPERRASEPRRDEFAQCPGGRWTGLLVPGSRPLRTAVGRARHPQRLARRRHADLHCKRLGCHQQRVPCPRFNPGNPATFCLYVQDRVRDVQLVLQASHFRLERAHLRIQRVAFARLCAALLRSQLAKRTLAPRLGACRI